MGSRVGMGAVGWDQGKSLQGERQVWGSTAQGGKRYMGRGGQRRPRGDGRGRSKKRLGEGKRKGQEWGKEHSAVRCLETGQDGRWEEAGRSGASKTWAGPAGMGGPCGRGRVLRPGPRRVVYSVMARFLCALRSLPFREVPGWAVRGRADRGGLGASTGPEDAGRTRALQAPPPLPSFRFPFTCQDLGARQLVLDLALTFLGKLLRDAPARPPPSFCDSWLYIIRVGGGVTEPYEDLCKATDLLSKRAHTFFLHKMLRSRAGPQGVVSAAHPARSLLQWLLLCYTVHLLQLCMLLFASEKQAVQTLHACGSAP